MCDFFTFYILLLLCGCKHVLRILLHGAGALWTVSIQGNHENSHFLFVAHLNFSDHAQFVGLSICIILLKCSTFLQRTLFFNQTWCNRFLDKGYCMYSSFFFQIKWNLEMKKIPFENGRLSEKIFWIINFTPEVPCDI